MTTHAANDPLPAEPQPVLDLALPIAKIRGEPLTDQERCDVWLSRLNAFQESRTIVRSLYDAVGGSAIYTYRSSLDRALRDMETMCSRSWAARSSSLPVGRTAS